MPNTTQSSAAALLYQPATESRLTHSPKSAPLEKETEKNETFSDVMAQNKEPAKVKNTSEKKAQQVNESSSSSSKAVEEDVPHGHEITERDTENIKPHEMGMSFSDDDSLQTDTPPLKFLLQSQNVIENEPLLSPLNSLNGIAQNNEHKALNNALSNDFAINTEVDLNVLPAISLPPLSVENVSRIEGGAVNPLHLTPIHAASFDTQNNTKTINPLASHIQKATNIHLGVVNNALPNGNGTPSSHIDPLATAVTQSNTNTISASGDTSILTGENRANSVLTSSTQFFKTLQKNTPFEQTLNAVKQTLEAGVSSPVLTETDKINSLQSSITNASELNHSAKISLPATIRFGNAAWPNMVAERATQMAMQNIQFAELKLNPEDLGPVQIKVSVNQDQASIAFNAANNQVREALDQTLFKLKEMLEQEGITLAESYVGSDSEFEQEQAQEENTQSTHSPETEEIDEELTTNTTLTVNYGIDSYV